MRVNYIGGFFGLIFLISLFGPWISKGYDSYGQVNPETGKLELEYHTIYNLSPIIARKIIDDKMVEQVLFPSIGLSISSGLLILAAVLFFIRFTKIHYNFIFLVFSFFGVSMFFLSIGRGQALGVKASLEWGFFITVSSIFLKFLYEIYFILITNK